MTGPTDLLPPPQAFPVGAGCTVWWFGYPYRAPFRRRASNDNPPSFIIRGIHIRIPDVLVIVEKLLPRKD